MAIGVHIINLLGQQRVTRVIGWLAGTRFPGFVVRMAVRVYCRIYKIDLEQFDFDIRQVKTFNEFFTRKWKPGVRQFESGIASPAEGYYFNGGLLKASKIIQCKGKLADQRKITTFEPFATGSFATIYLSPGDYHRVHAPFDMRIDRIAYIPGKLYPVNEKSVLKISQLYCKNERVVLSGSCSYGRFDFVFIGAMIVGKTVLSFIEDWDARIKKRRGFEEWVSYDLRKSEELGYFELGSTVLLLMDNRILDTITLEPVARVLLGQHLCG